MRPVCLLLLMLFILSSFPFFLHSLLLLHLLPIAAREFADSHAHAEALVCSRPFSFLILFRSRS